MLLYFINFHNRQHIYTEIKDINSSFRMEMHNREKFESLLNFPVAVFFSSNEKRNFGHNDLFAVQPIRTKIDICSPLLSSINARFFMGRLESIYVFSLVYIKTLFCAVSNEMVKHFALLFHGIDSIVQLYSSRIANFLIKL